MTHVKPETARKLLREKRKLSGAQKRFYGLVAAGGKPRKPKKGRC